MFNRCKYCENRSVHFHEYHGAFKLYSAVCQYCRNHTDWYRKKEDAFKAWNLENNETEEI